MRKLDIEKLKNKEDKDKYEEKIYEKMKEVKIDNVQNKWKEIVKTCIETAEETIGRKRTDKKSESKQIKNLSAMQKKIRNDINAISDPGKRADKRKERNKVLKEIHDTLQREQQKEIMRLVEEVETHKDDSRRMFQVVKQLQRRKEKKKIIVR